MKLDIRPLTLDGVVRYLDNPAWWGPLQTRVYGGERLGLLEPAG